MTTTFPNGAGVQDYEDVNVELQTEEEFEEMLSECEPADFSGVDNEDR